MLKNTRLCLEALLWRVQTGSPWLFCLLGLDIGTAPLYGFGVGHSVAFLIEYLRACPARSILNMSWLTAPS